LAAKVHATAEVSADASVGDGTSIWNDAQVRERARVGRDCIVGKGAYVDTDVVVGDRCKIQNRASLYRGVTLEDGVFIGPHVVFTNDIYPRAVNADGTLKSDADWECGRTLVREGASVGAGAVVLPDVTIGAWALVAAGSVVTQDVPSHALVKGNPARFAGWVCVCARPLRISERNEWECEACGRTFVFNESVV
jgi:acetyltransferase-like isoleucine patch superfamily enzyme